jgi:hypothetical protein
MGHAQWIKKFTSIVLLEMLIADFTSSTPGLWSSLIFRSGPPSIKAVPNNDGSIANFNIPWWKPITFKMIKGSQNIIIRNSSNIWAKRAHITKIAHTLEFSKLWLSFKTVHEIFIFHGFKL